MNRLLLTAIAAALSPCAVSAASYQFFDLGALQTGEFYASNINNQGSVVGQYRTSGGSYVGEVYSNGSFVTLPDLSNTTFTQANGQNDSGVIVGSSNNRPVYWDNGNIVQLSAIGVAGAANAINSSGIIVGSTFSTANWQTVATKWESGVESTLGTLGSGTFSFATDINSSGVIVGGSTISGTDNQRAFVYQDGVMTNLGSLSTAALSTSRALAINDSNQIVGVSDLTGGGFAAFLYQNGQMTNLGDLGGGSAQANDINAQGDIVGFSYTQSGMSAFLFSGGVMTDLNSLVPLQNFRLNYASSINNAGDIIGYGTVEGKTHAFLLSTAAPVPEPATWAMMLVGFGSIGFALRARQKPGVSFA